MDPRFRDAARAYLVYGVVYWIGGAYLAWHGVGTRSGDRMVGTGVAWVALGLVFVLLVPYLLDAIRAYENGLGTLEDIDKGMKLGCGYPMGPFTLLDFVGLDTTYYIANIMFEEFREPAYAPPPLLKRMVLAGRMGRKSGRGFYKYEV
jgi:hypothetical protein